MSDRFPAKIQFGGKVPNDLLKGLFQTARNEGLCLDWGEGPIDDFKEFKEHAVAGGEFVDNEACYGNFDDVEQFCQEHGIAYDRHSDAKYEYDAEISWWRPGMKMSQCVASDNSDSALIDAHLIRQALSTGTPREKVKAVQDLLDKQVPPTLPPLEVIDDGTDDDSPWSEMQ